MKPVGTAREALIVEALGDVAALMDRVESLLPLLARSEHALAQASADLHRSIVGFEGRMAATTELAKVKTVEHVVRRTNEVARQTLDQQRLAMHEAAKALFVAEMEPTLKRVAVGLQPLLSRVEQLESPWHRCLAQAVTAALACAASVTATVHWLIG